MGLLNPPRLRLVGDEGLLVEYGDAIDPEINRKVRVMAAALKQKPLEHVREVIPTYRSLLICYDSLHTGPRRVQEHLARLEEDLERIEIPPPRTVTIPVCYGGELGPDLEFVCGHTGLSQEEVVSRHSGADYQIYMIGFTPGFPFLGGMDPALATPRLETPRTLVPAGSVGIANQQTGVYPIDSPGGWRLIGRTPLRLFDPGRDDPFLYRAGDRIRFEPISRREYDRLAGRGAESDG